MCKLINYHGYFLYLSIIFQNQIDKKRETSNREETIDTRKTVNPSLQHHPNLSNKWKLQNDSKNGWKGIFFSLFHETICNKIYLLPTLVIFYHQAQW